MLRKTHTHLLLSSLHHIINLRVFWKFFVTLNQTKISFFPLSFEPNVFILAINKRSHFMKYLKINKSIINKLCTSPQMNLCSHLLSGPEGNNVPFEKNILANYQKTSLLKVHLDVWCLLPSLARALGISTNIHITCLLDCFKNLSYYLSR